MGVGIQNSYMCTGLSPRGPHYHASNPGPPCSREAGPILMHQAQRYLLLLLLTRRQLRGPGRSLLPPLSSCPSPLFGFIPCVRIPISDQLLPAMPLPSGPRRTLTRNLRHCRHGLPPEHLPQQPPPGESDTQSSIPFMVFSQEDSHLFLSSRCNKNLIPSGQIS